MLKSWWTIKQSFNRSLFSWIRCLQIFLKILKTKVWKLYLRIVLLNKWILLLNAVITMPTRLKWWILTKDIQKTFTFLIKIYLVRLTWIIWILITLIIWLRTCTNYNSCHTVRIFKFASSILGRNMLMMVMILNILRVLTHLWMSKMSSIK